MPLSYPVDTDARYDIWDVAANDFAVGTRNGKTRKLVGIQWGRKDGGEWITDPNLVPLLRVRLPNESYDSATQVLYEAKPVIDLVAQTSSYQYKARNLAQEELDRIADEQAAEAELEIIKSMHQALKDGIGDNLARLERCERVLAYLLKKLYQAE